MKKIQKQKKGFTLLEILLVIALIGILVTIIIVIVNPKSRFASARNDIRQSDIKKIEAALIQYRLQEGSYPVGLDGTLRDICDPDIANPSTNCGTNINLSVLVPIYLQSIPQDLNDKDTTGGNGYQVAVDTTRNIVAVKAIQAESSATISINDPLPAEPTVVTNTPLAATVLVNPIVTSGLVLHLDAVNTASYPGTGTTWFDISGNGNNLTLINSPAYNSSGYFSTGATGYFTGSGSASIPTGNSSYTMMVWARLSNGNYQRGLISIGGFGANNQSNALRTANNATLGNFIHYWWANDLYIINNNANLSNGTWFMVAAQFDGTNRRVWANTTNVGSDTPTGHNVTSTTIQVGTTNGTEYFQGDIAIAQIYNRALTAQEIQQNFNATKGRFGL